MKAFIDFYSSLNFIPVRQNIDSHNFISSRHFLYSKLGVPIIFLKDLDILEFGPRGGLMQRSLQVINHPATTL